MSSTRTKDPFRTLPEFLLLSEIQNIEANIGASKEILRIKKRLLARIRKKK